MASRKMYRTHRLEFQGAEPYGSCLRVHVQQQAMQGPAGWVNVGPVLYVDLPYPVLLADRVTDWLDKMVRKTLKRLWTVEREDGLF